MWFRVVWHGLDTYLGGIRIVWARSGITEKIEESLMGFICKIQWEKLPPFYLIAFPLLFPILLSLLLKTPYSLPALSLLRIQAWRNGRKREIEKFLKGLQREFQDVCSGKKKKRPWMGGKELEGKIWKLEGIWVEVGTSWLELDVMEGREMEIDPFVEHACSQREKKESI
ncbi:hypothetical protein Tco_0821258 [Tanacetum coccineum]|uniref:Uncharacterized protein n=1 Tax=Tanacetum coccineum TaxID=301880 RepID=A0ABQ5AG21_9ASTR